jgi:hypothetical protein
LEELQENREIYGVQRVWELLGVVDWPTKILKKGDRSLESLPLPTDLLSSNSTKCKTAKRPFVMENFCKQSQDAPKADPFRAEIEPTPEDEECIYNFLSHSKNTIPEPEFKQQRVPALSMKYLMEQRDRIQKGVRMSREQSGYKYPNTTTNEIKPIVSNNPISKHRRVCSDFSLLKQLSASALII